MANQTLVTPADIAAIESAGLRLSVGADLPCTSPELRRIFGLSALGRVLVLSIAETTKGALVSWQ
ncbi:MAG: hypothetical protein HZT43_03515 [Exiguobacterium profundum]|nr:MAG: hypothetical protein HZT43_03515 [Exiguobacterium profundum]